MQVQWNVQKKGGFPHSQSFYVCMERMQSRISTLGLNLTQLLRLPHISYLSSTLLAQFMA